MTTSHRSSPPPPRAVPEDLRRLRFSSGHVVGVTDDVAKARAAVEALLQSGVDERQLILVSEEVDTLPYGENDERLEVRHTAPRARAAARTGGVAVGAGSCASIGLLAAFFGAGSYPLFALVGAAIGAALGAVVAPAIVLWMRRRAEQGFEEYARDGIVVGVGLERDSGEERAEAYRSILDRSGLRVLAVEATAAG